MWWPVGREKDTGRDHGPGITQRHALVTYFLHLDSTSSNVYQLLKSATQLGTKPSTREPCYSILEYTCAAGWIILAECVYWLEIVWVSWSTISWLGWLRFRCGSNASISPLRTSEWPQALTLPRCRQHHRGWVTNTVTLWARARPHKILLGAGLGLLNRGPLCNPACRACQTLSRWASTRTEININSIV